jgi:hypothetical protein
MSSKAVEHGAGELLGRAEANALNIALTLYSFCQLGTGVFATNFVARS